MMNIGIIGLGYVGLPLAVEFGKLHPTIGFDINQARIDELKKGIDSTLEVQAEELSLATHLQFSFQEKDLERCTIYIITVPTPIDKHKRPDLQALFKASKMVGQVLKKDDIVIYESTVYPGVTEDECAPILEVVSGLQFNIDFFCGYSPERVNPGDKTRRIADIVKVTSGSTPEIANEVDALYQSIVTAGTHRAPSIRIAEAAKVIENTQRDINIGLINEIAIIFNKLGIDTEEVLKAAGTKWNFLPFRPGLVGGHCIGVDPYYLTHKAQEVGYHPEIILAGRRLNDGMGLYVGSQLIKSMMHKKIELNKARILIMGLSFKENCPDIRNTRVIDVIRQLTEYNIIVDCYDPWVSPEDATREFGIEVIKDVPTGFYDAIVIAVAHKKFVDMGVDSIKSFCKEKHIIYDIKNILPANQTCLRL